MKTTTKTTTKATTKTTKATGIYAASARSPHMRGAARRWRYWSCGLYEAVISSDGTRAYWEGPISVGPSRRSERLMHEDLEELSGDEPVLDWAGSIRHRDATEMVASALLERALRVIAGPPPVDFSFSDDEA